MLCRLIWHSHWPNSETGQLCKGEERRNTTSFTCEFKWLQREFLVNAAKINFHYSHLFRLIYFSPGDLAAGRYAQNMKSINDHLQMNCFNPYMNFLRRSSQSPVLTSVSQDVQICTVCSVFTFKPMILCLLVSQWSFSDPLSLHGAGPPGLPQSKIEGLQIH